ncbi:hypothetical protein FRC11_012554 [Ceratobasidium sp. 423]|nr:hypothetical protein FRC11_012554 [Ceratobasidium sp. 423]
MTQPKNDIAHKVSPIPDFAPAEQAPPFAIQRDSSKCGTSQSTTASATNPALANIPNASPEYPQADHVTRPTNYQGRLHGGLAVPSEYRDRVAEQEERQGAMKNAEVERTYPCAAPYAVAIFRFTNLNYALSAVVFEL